MSTIDRERIFDEVSGFIDRSAGSTYNLADILLSPLYLDSIQENKRPSALSLKKKVIRFVYRAKGFFRHSSLPNKKFDIIFWPVEYSHIRQMEAVNVNLTKQGFCCVWVANKKKIIDQLKDKNQEVVYVPDSLSLNFSLMKMLRKSIAPDFSSHRFKDVIKTYLPFITGLIKLNERIISRFHPKALLVGNDLTVEGRVASMVFKKNGIFTSCIQHGDMSGPLHAKHVVDNFFLYGIKSFEQVIKYDSSARFVVSGAPYLEKSQKSDDWLLNDLQVQFPRYILVALSGPGNNTSYPHHQLLSEAVFKLACEVEDIQVIVKLHPKDRLENYQKLITQYKTDRIRVIPYTPDTSIFSWLTKCDMLITGASTTAIEAMHVGIPVITLDFMNEYKGFAFIDEGATMHRNDYLGLREAVQVLCSSDHERKARIERGRAFAANYFFSDSGQPSVRIADLILKGMESAKMELNEL